MSAGPARGSCAPCGTRRRRCRGRARSGRRHRGPASTISRVSSSRVASMRVGSPVRARAADRRRLRWRRAARHSGQARSAGRSRCATHRRGHPRTGWQGSGPARSCRACRMLTSRCSSTAGVRPGGGPGARSAALGQECPSPMRKARLGPGAAGSGSPVAPCRRSAGMLQEVGDRRRHRGAPRRRLSAPPQDCAICATRGARTAAGTASIEASACASSSPSSLACRRRNPIRYAVAGYGVFSWIIGGVTEQAAWGGKGNARGRARGPAFAPQNGSMISQDGAAIPAETAPLVGLGTAIPQALFWRRARA